MKEKKVKPIPKGYHAVTPYLSVKGASVHIHLYVKNSDEVAERAVAAGAKILRPVQDQFYGDRSGSVEDPFGHVWHVATHTKDVSMSELKKHAAAMASTAEKS